MDQQLEPLWDVLGSGATANFGGINPYELIPPNMAYSHYMGSLTTPPCSEMIKTFQPILTQFVATNMREVVTRACSMKWTACRLHDFSKHVV